MLIEFSVSNFRSFRERQTLSMVAAPHLRKRHNVLRTQLEGEKFPDLLKVAAIYGPNASGKSNLVLAFATLGMIFRQEPRAQPSRIPVSPFRFDPTLSKADTRFEVHFITEGKRYSMELACNAERITEEKLTAFVRAKSTVLYSRVHSGDEEHYEFSDELEGGNALHDTWRRLTGPQVTFLSQAAANSEEQLKQLKIPHLWLTSKLSTVDGQAIQSYERSSRKLALEDPGFGEEIAEFLRHNDIPIDTIKVHPGMKGGLGALVAASLDADTRHTAAAVEPGRTVLTHKTALGLADFSLEEESQGTRNLIGFWLPWSLMFRAPEYRCVLVVDELDTSLHPKIVENLIKIHLELAAPTQLIFTTHDTHLMDSKLLRRDQFWLTERDANGATQLRSIHDFEGRDSEDIEKRYYEGRYRSLPLIRS